MKSAPRQPGLPFPRLCVAAGPRSVEAQLLARIDELFPQSSPDPSLLRQPVWVIVPSRSLRLHVNAAVARHRGRGLAGLAVRTHQTVAREILLRAGETPPRGDAVFDLLVRRFARADPTLAAALDHLRDGYGSIVTTVRDLMDAGFEAVHGDALMELLDSVDAGGWPRAELARARAIVRVAQRLAQTLEDREWGRRIVALHRARELLDRDPARALPARAVLLTGYADAVGLVSDFLEALLLRRNAELFLDQPADPRHPQRPDAGAAYTERLMARLAPHAVVERASDRTPTSRREHFAAPGASAEVHEVAVRVRRLLDKGAHPESIGIVARDLASYRLHLRDDLRRLAIPASGVGTTGPRDPQSRWRAALSTTLRQGERCTSDTWLDALGTLGEEAPLRRFDLRLAMRALGAVRLSDVAHLDIAPFLDGEDGYALPLRAGLVSDRADDRSAYDDDREGPEDSARAGQSLRARRRRISGPVLRQAIEAADALLESLEAWPSEATLAEHGQFLTQQVASTLSWDEERYGWLAAALERLAGDVPPDLALFKDEFFTLLGRCVAADERLPLAGAGGGVQLLTAMEARSRTFTHLFVMGLNRDVFPRTVRRDPLLSDELRRRLQPVLPDIPIKDRGHAEERHLFAQLLSAGDHVTTSWQTVAEDGRERTPSPLLQRLGEAADPQKVSIAPHPHGVAEFTRPRFPSARQAAILTALYGSRTQLKQAWRQAHDMAEPASPSRQSAAAVLEARWNVLQEHQRMSAFGNVDDLGPYMGFLGAVAESDPRRSPLFVTRIEGFARCGWQTMLGRVLGLEPTPDPLQALPGVDALLLGNAVHAVLESIAGRSRGTQTADLSVALTQTPIPVAWPEESALEAIVRQECRRIVRNSGLGLPGIARVLEEQVKPCLQLARDWDWQDGKASVSVVGTELQGQLQIQDHQGNPRPLGYRVDRVDRLADGTIVLTDYKTGKPISESANPKTRQTNFLDMVSRGEKLQAIVYALGAAHGHHLQSQGRFLFVKASRDYPEREFTAGPGDAAMTERMADAIRRALAGWDEGAFLPRLVDGDGRTPMACDWCDVREACLQGDSGARARLKQWIQARGGHVRGELTAVDGPPLTPAEAAALAAWQLKTKPASTRKSR